MRARNLLVVCGMVVLVAMVVAADEPLGNHLAYPAVYTVGLPDLFDWAPYDPAEFGVTYSYGCNEPESIDQFNYPNTSCIDEDGSEPRFMDAEECVGAGNPCEGFTAEALDVIYWQKVDGQSWSAETSVQAPPISAAYLDWSDNIESNTWSVTSVIRIETQPFFSSIAGFDPAVSSCDELDPCLMGLQMWHASGHGTSERWGVRVDDSDPANHAPYVYLSPFAVIHTSRARLNIAKLEQAGVDCPTPGGEPVPPPILPLEWVVEEDGDGDILSGWWINPGGEDPCELDDLEQTVELNVGGKWTYGYVWMTKRMDFTVCEADDFEVGGWWRLTFYTEDNSVDFTGREDGYWESSAVLEAPPEIKADPLLFSVESEPDEGSMYPPMVDSTNNLTYIDICLTTKGGGGGGGHGPPSTP